MFTWISHVPDQDFPVFPAPGKQERSVTGELDLCHTSLLAFKETETVTPLIFQVDAYALGVSAHSINLVQNRVGLWQKETNKKSIKDMPLKPSL